LRHVKLIVSMLAAAMLLAIPASAAARSRDRNHDKIPDRWERVHHLSLKVKQAKRDQDRDGLRNRAEFRSHMDPRDADSDDDGIEDGDEHAGRVVSFDGTTLTIAVFGSGKISGEVTGETDIECDEGDDSGHGTSEKAAWRNEQADEGDGATEDDPAEDDDPGDDPGDDQGGDDEGDEDSCPDGALKPGAIVQEAVLSVTPEGTVFETLELVG
jgi:hypothetical protein